MRVQGNDDEDRLKKKLQYLKGYRQFWIGLNDQKKEKYFEWSDGTISEFRNWAAGEPNNHISKEEENCVEFQINKNNWNDISCSVTRSFICQFSTG